MEIVKSLDINKRYNKVLNGSIVMAKNMRVNEDNSALELDEGFKDVLLEAIEKYNEDNNTTLTFDPIVGIIECPKEVVLFTYSHLPSPNGTSNIYRLKEIGDNEVELVKCNTAWQYNGGYRNSTYVNSHINGTYTYNVKGELIVTIGEYTDDNQDVPLRIINLDLDTHTNQLDDYNVAPNVPIANLKFISNVSGSPMPTGTYYFFIRYEITKNEYTNWFPIGVPYRAINEEAKTLFNHGQVNPNQLTVTVNNTHKDAVTNPSFNLTISETNFKRYQIGYILQHSSSTVARLYKTFTLLSTNYIIFDAKYKEEIAIEELLENPLGLYNVHCLASFENRTYIANYKEEDAAQDSTLQTIANNISVTGVVGSAMPRYGFNGLNNPTAYGESTSLYTIHDSKVIDEDEGGDDDPVIPDEHILVFRATDVFFDEQSADGNNYYKLRNMGAPINLGIHGISQYTSLSDDTLINKSFLFGSTTGLNLNNRLVNDNTDNSIFYLFFPPYNKTVNISVELRVSAVDGTASSAGIGVISSSCINTSLVGTISEETIGLNTVLRFTVNVSSTGTTTLGNDEGYSVFAFDFGSTLGSRTEYIKDIYISSGTVTIARRNVDSTTTNNTSTSQTTLKDDFTFNEFNSHNSISLYDLLTVKHFGTWLFDSTVESNISTGDRVKIGSANNLFIQNLNIYLDDSQYPGGIAKGNYFKGFYQDATRRFEITFNNFTLYSNNNTYKSIDFEWGDNAVRNLDNLEWINNLLGVSNSVGSFDPEEKYQFYIHFVRTNGTHTHAYPIPDTLNPRKTYGIYLYYPTFSNITVPDGYIGYFISYKQISNRRLYSGVIVSLGGKPSLSDSIYHARVRSIETELALTPYRGTYAVLEKDDGSSYTIGNNARLLSSARILLGNIPSVGFAAGLEVLSEDTDLKKFGSLGLPGFIDLEFSNSITESDIATKHVISVFSENPDNSTVRDYSSSADIIPLGPVIKASGSNLSFTADITYDINYPVYIEKETTYFFNHRIYFDETQAAPKYYNIISDSYTLDDLHIKYLDTYTYLKYTKHIIKALEIKKEPSVVTTASQAKDKNYFITNTYVLPQDSQDLYNYPSEYFKRVYKSYLTFEDITYFETHFTKTIRRSNVLSDESAINSLRNFNATQYKVISSNKGNITALVALGTDLLIHTENTLFRLSKQAILEADLRSVDVTAGDLFSVDPQEVFTANHGYGGLQVENNWCTNEHGYWFYDRDSHKLFNLDNGQLNDISEPIVKYLNSIYPADVRFNTDFKNHRVLISFKENDSDTHNPVTFSFNALTKSFISIHDFYFGVRCNTKNNVYFLGYLGYRDPATENNVLNIYKFNGVANRTYYNLSSVAANFPEFVDADWDANQCAAYIDIIFNNQYPIIRNLESINYLLGYKEEFDDFDYKLFEDREKYSGNYIEIYTDSTDSRILDLSQGTEVNNYNDYKHPHYNKGQWQFNYFRNIVSKELTPAQLNDYIARLGLTESALPYIINGITDNDNPSQIDQVIRPSDERSLIYGKYIIVRFIFTNTNDKQIRFEDVSVNINNY